MCGPRIVRMMANADLVGGLVEKKACVTSETLKGMTLITVESANTAGILRRVGILGAAKKTTGRD